jgi:heme-degrading monooxygenase HmoA
MSASVSVDRTSIWPAGSLYFDRFQSAQREARGTIVGRITDGRRSPGVIGPHSRVEERTQPTLAAPGSGIGWPRRGSDRQDGVMILEHAVLEVHPGSSAEFEAAFAAATPIIAASPGFHSLRLERCLEQPDRYVLLVEWDSVVAHEEGFRQSAAYEDWRRLLHHFYPTRPTVQHFETALEV